MIPDPTVERPVGVVLEIHDDITAGDVRRFVKVLDLLAVADSQPLRPMNTHSRLQLRTWAGPHEADQAFSQEEPTH